MTEDKFQNILDDLWERINKYEAKFGNKYDIRFLVSKAAQQYRTPTVLSSYVQRDPFDCYTYLLGRRVIFIDQDYIHSAVSDCPGLIKPVICCRDLHSFPMEAEPGDYVLYARNMKQVIEVTYEDCDKAVHIKDIPGNLSDDPIIYMDGSDKPDSLVDQWLEFKRHNEQRRDSWMSNVDSAEINDYLSSLTIT